MASPSQLTCNLNITGNCGAPGAGGAIHTVPSRGFCCYMAFMNGLVRQHRLPNNVADRKNIGYIGSHLCIDRNKAALINLHTGSACINLLPIGGAPHCY